MSGDVYFGNVTSLLHFDGANASTTFTDVIGKTWTPTGTAQISTAQSLYGGASGLIDAVNGQVTTPDDPSLEIGSGDFTIEFAARFGDLTSLHLHTVLQKGTKTGWGTFRAYTFGSTISWAMSSDGATWNLNSDGNNSGLSINTWYRFAISCNSGTVRFFRDGVQKGSGVSIGTISDSPNTLQIGDATDSAGTFYIDELRITKGVGRYTANYTPDTAAFPDTPLVGVIAIAPKPTLLAGSNGVIAIAPHPASLIGSDGMIATAPRPTFAIGVSGINATAPKPTIVSAFSPSLNNAIIATAPPPRMSGVVTVGNYLTFSGRAPLPRLRTGNSEIIAVAPLPRVIATILSGNVLGVSARAPRPRISASLENRAIIKVDAIAPAPRLFAKLATGNVLSATITAPSPLLLAAGFSGNYATLSITAPRPRLSAIGWGDSILSISAHAPVPRLDAHIFATLPENFRTWVMNMKNRALTEYTGITFNSFCQFQGTTLAASSGGVFELGTQDQDGSAPIHAVIRDGKLEYGTSFLKRVPEIFVGLEAAGDMLVSTITTEFGTSSEVLPYGGLGLMSRRVKTGRGAKSRYWQWQIENRNGSDFTLSSVALSPIVLSRRLTGGGNSLRMQARAPRPTLVATIP